MNLDTAFLVDLLRKTPGALEQLEALSSGEQRLAVTVVAAGELYRGAFAHPRPADKVRELESLLDLLVLLEMNLPAAKSYGQLWGALRRQGRSVPDRDLLIAAIGLAYGESVVLTRNAADFAGIPGVEVATY